MQQYKNIFCKYSVTVASVLVEVYLKFYLFDSMFNFFSHVVCLCYGKFDFNLFNLMNCWNLLSLISLILIVYYRRMAVFNIGELIIVFNWLGNRAEHSSY